MYQNMWMEETPEEFIEYFSFVDDKQVYTNGSELIPVFRVKQMMEHYFREMEPVVHAHWIPRHRRGNNWCECSNCNTVGSPFWKRCPMCEAKMDETTELRTCYCPQCDKHFKVRSNDSGGDCPDCGHHVVLREVEVADG